MATSLFIGPTAKNRWVIDGHLNEISKVKDYKAKSDCSEVIYDPLVEGHDTGVKILL